MPWTIERRHPHVAVVTMNTNKVNAQNPAFFADLHAAFDHLEAEFGDCAVVLTGAGAIFTAGLDFDHHFPLFARRSIKEIDAWFDAYRDQSTSVHLPKAHHRSNQRSRLCRRTDYRTRLRSPHSRGRSAPVLVKRGAHRHPDAGRLLRDHQACGRSACGIRIDPVRSNL
jgi:hypothetical protein